MQRKSKLKRVLRDGFVVALRPRNAVDRAKLAALYATLGLEELRPARAAARQLAHSKRKRNW